MNQYCKVGTTRNVTNLENPLTTLQHHQHQFCQKASSPQYAGTSMGHFFEKKAQQFQNSLESLLSNT